MHAKINEMNTNSSRGKDRRVWSGRRSIPRRSVRRGSVGRCSMRRRRRSSSGRRRSRGFVPAGASLRSRRWSLLDGVDTRAAVGTRGFCPSAVVPGCFWDEIVSCYKFIGHLYWQKSLHDQNATVVNNTMTKASETPATIFVNNQN